MLTGLVGLVQGRDGGHGVDWVQCGDGAGFIFFTVALAKARGAAVTGGTGWTFEVGSVLKVSINEFLRQILVLSAVSFLQQTLHIVLSLLSIAHIIQILGYFPLDIIYLLIRNRLFTQIRRHILLYIVACACVSDIVRQVAVEIRYVLLVLQLLQLAFVVELLHVIRVPLYQVSDRAYQLVIIHLMDTFLECGVDRQVTGSASRTVITH